MPPCSFRMMEDAKQISSAERLSKGCGLLSHVMMDERYISKVVQALYIMRSRRAHVDPVTHSLYARHIA